MERTKRITVQDDRFFIVILTTLNAVKGRKDLIEDGVPR